MSYLKCLYIPDFVLPEDIKIIKEKFELLGYGKILDIVLVEQAECEYHVDKDIYSAAYVYVDYWNDNDQVKDFQDKIKDNTQEAKLMYDNVNYWVFEEVFIDLNGRVLNMEKQISSVSQYLNNINYQLTYCNNGIQYLLYKDKNKIIKQDRKLKAITKYKNNLKEQKKWRNRLRPLDVLKKPS